MSEDEEQEHILSNFQEALNQLRKDVLTMGSTAQLNLERSVHGLLERKTELCSQAIADDEEVYQLEKTIDSEGMRILALFNPVASDLRQVVSTMKMATNIERISDEAGNIARRARLILKNEELPEINLIDPVYKLAADLLNDSLHAFSERDLEAARGIDAKDDALDDAHNNLVKHLRKRMEEDPAHLKDYLDLMFMVRSLERVGDHATNIAEDTIFIESAEDVRHTG
jgi:phosphate transport system protein